MKLKPTIIAASLALGFAGAAQAQSTPGSTTGSKMGIDTSAQRAEEKALDAEYKAAREKCTQQTGNAKDICVAEAKGKHNVARAEQEAKERNTPRAQYNVEKAKAEAAYDVAKERCDDQKADARSTSVKEARATYDQAIAKAKAELASSEKSRAGTGGSAPKQNR